jgi:hypothetical protein
MRISEDKIHRLRADVAWLLREQERKDGLDSKHAALREEGPRSVPLRVSECE